MITQEEITLARTFAGSSITVPRGLLRTVIDAAQAYFDTKDFVAISKTEYDWLVDRSHRLEGLEL